MDEIRTNASPISYGVAPPNYRLPDATRLGAVHLQVADAGRSVAYYRDVIGLQVVHEHDGIITMGASDARPLIVLHERVGARPVPPRGRLGLFHVAILLPDRASLGRFLAHLSDRGERPGMSDHLVSEAIYLTDPDGLGLEIYADRPRSAWRAEGRQLVMSTEPLDVRGVLAAGGNQPFAGVPARTTIGHVHLHVGDLPSASSFYHDGLGFDRVVWQYPGALFLSAGGYHHHLGTNIWARNAEPAHDDEARLLEWTIEVPTVQDVTAVAGSVSMQGGTVQADGNDLVVDDPWGTAVRVRPISLQGTHRR